MMGFGYLDAPVFLLGEFPKDAKKKGVFDVSRAETFEYVAGEKYPMVRALQRVRLTPRLIYGTTALKCQADHDDVMVRHRVACLVEHLGVELEMVQPPVIWMTGRKGLDMVRRHFRSHSVPEMSIGQVSKIRAPDSWRVSDILLVRSPHPAQVRHGPQDYEMLERMAAIVAVYVDNLTGAH